MATTPVFLPGKCYGQRSLASYSPYGCKSIRQDLETKQQAKQAIHPSGIPAIFLRKSFSIDHKEYSGPCFQS